MFFLEPVTFGRGMKRGGGFFFLEPVMWVKYVSECVCVFVRVSDPGCYLGQGRGQLLFFFEPVRLEGCIGGGEGDFSMRRRMFTCGYVCMWQP